MAYAILFPLHVRSTASLALVAAMFTRTHGATALLFPLGVRLSTWLCLAAFVVVAIRQRSARPLAAAVAWFFGFEATYQLCAYLTGEGLPATTGFAIAFTIIVGVIVVALAAWWRVLPYWPLMAAAALVWAVWIAIGFPANGPSLVGLNPWSEVLNEAAKVLWAAAYFVPLIQGRIPAPHALLRLGSVTGDSSPSNP